MSKLRESPWTAKSPPPLSSPLAKQVKSRKMNRVNPRSTSFESTKYIEHLESQLAAVNSKLDLMMSPTTNRARSAKLRALSNESRSLRQEVSNWEKSFEERVKEEIDRRAELEIGMRSHIQSLEEEMKVKDARMKELEWELDNMSNKVRETEGLGDVNVNLERRIDVLTSLVAQSPTKLDLCSATSSPTKTDPFNRAQRRRSMLPRLPSSPGGVRLSLNTAIDSGFWSSRRLGSVSSTLASPEGTNLSIEEEGPEKVVDHSSHAPQSSTISSASTSFPSLPFSSTRPTSMHSTSSGELTSPEIPFGSDIDSQTKSISRQRRMRRFPSGLCTLKPLILPKATVSPLPASAPISATSGMRPRHISNVSLDPTMAFLSKIDGSSPFSTPTQGSRQRSATWAQEETLKTLERNSKEFGLMNENAGALSPSPLQTPLDFEVRDATEQQKARRPRPLSLEKELELANMMSPNNLDDALVPVDLEDSVLGTIPIGLERSLAGTPLTNKILPPQKSPSEADITPRPRGCEGLFPSKPKSIPLVALAKGNAFGIFTRLTGLMHRVKQDPVVLAQRLLSNAWTLGSARLGGAGWWLLGLIFRSQRQGRGLGADGKTAEDSAPGAFNWDHLSAKASKRRTVERYVGDHGGRVHEDKSSPRHSSRPQTSPVTPSAVPRAEPHLFPCDACIEPSSRRTFRLWFHFSLAIVLAVGVAIKHGPGTLLMDQTLHSAHGHPVMVSERSKSKSPEVVESPESEELKPGGSTPAGAQTNNDSKDGVGGYHVTFAPILGPEHYNEVE